MGDLDVYEWNNADRPVVYWAFASFKFKGLETRHPALISNSRNGKVSIRISLPGDDSYLDENVFYITKSDLPKFKKYLREGRL